ncbi:ABC transporter permease [Rathayibacter rathayi]|uniref:ABC transporter permease n=1 Tax=Rathayibacter rathayi TaxID=33887 RepID=A0ABD6WC14_RATRA|nr:ABC transporter permease [Rathayibacter rathayi]AZZ47930.1 ABC transporter permease [Rathayibacter rathayi]MWV74810.1 ABC transporter permease [Rathayibacter rathayi NCPPB 2980 = VKM Ac-1601]PPF15578.1 ABC transporter permease [Rathayibacter rathayi]PPF26004.1 ABC transporter permease [Rathayibacter rathayi]PPF51281.1 ABC transporter permease [Rathayibacter rathayi]
MTASLDSPPRSALAELSLTNARELLRDGKTMFFIVFFPLFFLGLFSFLASTIDAKSPQPVVAVTQSADSAAFVHRLEAAGFVASEAAPGATAQDATAVVTIHDASASVLLDAEKKPQWRGLVDSIAADGIAKTSITAVYTDGSAVFDPLRTSLASIVMVSFLTLALLGTAVPVVALRGKGTLRLLGTTPLRRSTFILSQSPARFLLGVAQLALVVAVAAVLGYLSPAATPRLIVTALLGLTMLFAIGYLFGSRASNSEATTTVLSLLIPVALMLSGSVIPLSVFPAQVQAAVGWLPTTVLAKALSVDLVGDVTAIDLRVAWGVMAAVAVLAVVLASVLFRWDQGEER